MAARTRGTVQHTVQLMPQHISTAACDSAGKPAVSRLRRRTAAQVRGRASSGFAATILQCGRLPTGAGSPPYRDLATPDSGASMWPRCNERCIDRLTRLFDITQLQASIVWERPKSPGAGATLRLLSSR